MSGNDISTLSYKELQALALRYRVPGNIKKQLLIEVLQAARRGNEREVDKLLADLRQTRKKRIRKAKPNKSPHTSTPNHSPNYNIGDEYYTTQPRLPYQWVGAEEEIVNRQDDSIRPPPYEEFRQFLLRRIQIDYETYNTNNNERSGTASTIEFRSNGESIRQMESSSKSGFVAGVHSVQSYPDQLMRNHFECQIVNDSNGNGTASLLLRRMLQAPAGADLGEIASPETNNGRNWPVESQEQNNELDNSDTLTAISDTSGNVDNWPIGTEYCRFVSNVRDQLFPNQPHHVYNSRNAQEGGQSDTVTNDVPNHYQILYTNDLPDEHQTVQQWESPVAIENQGLHYSVPRISGAKSFPAIYYNESSANYTSVRSLDVDPLQQEYPNDNGSAYAGNQGVFENNATTVSQMDQEFQQNLINNNVVGQEREGPADGYYVQHSTNEPTNAYATPTHLPSYAEHQPSYQPSIPELPMPNLQPLQPHAHRFFGNPSNCNVVPSQEPEGCIRHQQFYKNQYHTDNVTLQQGCTESVVISSEASKMQSTATIKRFQPSHAFNDTSEGHLENLLNLTGQRYTDYAKVNQTSCIYCYTAPIVTQKLFSAGTLCSQKRHFIAEIRQHTFSSYCLSYNDAATGMQLAKPKDQFQLVDCSSDTKVGELNDNLGATLKQFNNRQENNDIGVTNSDYKLTTLPSIIILGGRDRNQDKSSRESAKVNSKEADDGTNDLEKTDRTDQQTLHTEYLDENSYPEPSNFLENEFTSL